MRMQKSVLSDFGSADDVVAQLPTVSGSDGSYSVFGRGIADVYINNRTPPVSAALMPARSHSLSPSARWGRSVSAGFLRPRARALSLSRGPDPSALRTIPSTHSLPLAAPWGTLSPPPSPQTAVDQRVSAFRPRGVPGPTSKLSPRAPAQMGRRETEQIGRAHV